MHPQWQQLEEAIARSDFDGAISLVQQNPDLLWTHDVRMNSAVTLALPDKLDIVHELALKLLEALKLGMVPEDRMYGAVHDLGEAWHSEWGGGWEVAEPYVVGLLHHSDDQLRYIAMNVLAYHWDTSKHRTEFEHALDMDPEDTNRAMAAGGLGFVLRATRDNQATTLLLSKLRDEDEDELVREASYGALLQIWLGWERANHLTLPRLLDQSEERDWIESVDWNLIDKISKGELPEA